jgi:hypothetical protein
MKKVSIALIVVMIALSLVGCSSSPASTPAPAPATTPQPAKVVTAESVVKSLKDAGLPIDNIVVYTAETDTNKLLGRPNQYISKVNFGDTRIKDNTDNGTVEVFANAQDAKSRKDYIETITKGSPLFLQYIYLKDKVLLRVDKALTPTQAAEYEAALGKIVK